jgi:glutamyl/glutaminyl-tRNA synthetase
LENLAEITSVAIKSIYESELGQQILQNQQKLYSSIDHPEIDTDQILLETTHQWQQAIKEWLKHNQKDTGSYLWPLRTALSGKLKSPSPFELLSVLEVGEVEKRINACLDYA